jgi:hypothetical protein
VHPPTLTAAAVEHLAGRPLVLRASTRNGCCGGRAAVPVAEVGTPSPPDGYAVAAAGPVRCFVAPELAGQRIESWTVDAVGIGRWRRLYLDGTEGIDPSGT